MRPIGFSTGALALGDFRRALAMLSDLALPVLELSALRVRELQPLVEALDDLGVERRFAYVAFHAPSRVEVEEEGRVVALLRQVANRGWPVVVHPGVMWTPALWQPLGDLLCIENMDQRNAAGRTCSELAALFATYPAATFCLDLGHARRIDPSMVEAYRMLRRFGDRLRQIHLSEVTIRRSHVRISLPARLAFQRVARLVPAQMPIVLEAVLDAQAEMAPEIRTAEDALRPPSVHAPASAAAE
jgi:sugar phosphate isomerase/epimerase